MKKLQIEASTKWHLKTNMMNLKNSVLLLFLVVLLGSGCFKQDPAISENITWKGRVLERGTNKPLSKAKVYLYRKISSDFDPLGGGSGAGALIDSFYTTNNGSFAFTYFSDISYSYSLKGVADGYYLGESEGTLGTRKDPRTDILLDPMAWIKFHVKNVNPFDEYDIISINSGEFHFIGDRIDTIFISRQIGNQKFNYYNFIYKNGQKTMYKDSIDFIPAHDTIFHEIKY